MDFDDVFTDNLAPTLAVGKETVFLNPADGVEISQPRNIVIPMIVTSTERNTVVSARHEKLQIECVPGIGDKLPVLRDWAARISLSLKKFAFVGNDLNDIECMKRVEPRQRSLMPVRSPL